jgi:hypothetical protein
LNNYTRYTPNFVNIFLPQQLAFFHEPSIYKVVGLDSSEGIRETGGIGARDIGWIDVETGGSHFPP